MSLLLKKRPEREICEKCQNGTHFFVKSCPGMSMYTLREALRLMGTHVHRYQVGWKPDPNAPWWDEQEPPEGDGFALIQTTSDVVYSPIFATVEELVAWWESHEGFGVDPSEWFFDYGGKPDDWEWD